MFGSGFLFGISSPRGFLSQSPSLIPYLTIFQSFFKNNPTRYKNLVSYWLPLFEQFVMKMKRAGKDGKIKGRRYYLLILSQKIIIQQFLKHQPRILGKVIFNKWIILTSRTGGLGHKGGRFTLKVLFGIRTVFFLVLSKILVLLKATTFYVVFRSSSCPSWRWRAQRGDRTCQVGWAAGLWIQGRKTWQQTVVWHSIWRYFTVSFLLKLIFKQIYAGILNCFTSHISTK